MKRNTTVVTDVNEVFELLDRCTSLSIAMNDGPYPYVIPMTFGAVIEDGKIVIYLHSAAAGKKCELLAADPHVCVEAHTYYRTEAMGKGMTARYESVIGFGEAELVEDQQEKIKGMKVMLGHYNNSGFPVTSCEGMTRVAVYKVVLDEVSGKTNL